MKLNTNLFGINYDFKSVKEVMAKANEQKSGDTLAGIGAKDAKERVAAKYVLSDLTVEDITSSPAVDYNKDSVTKIIIDDWNTKKSSHSQSANCVRLFWITESPATKYCKRQRV